MNLINLVGNKLEELGYPVQWQLRPEEGTSLTYAFVWDNDTIFTTDGKETEYILQVDVWAKDDYTELVKQVISKMEEIDFFKEFATDDYEEDTMYYHKIIRFNYLESEE